MGFIRFVSLLTLVALLGGHPSYANAPFVSVYRSPCQEFLKAGPLGSLRALSEIKELKIATYNVLNLYLQVGHYEYANPQAPRTRVKTKPERDKPHAQLLGVAQAIEETNPDILVLQEIESFDSLRNFSEEYLGGRYRPLLIPGNDARGIQIGFLVKKDLPLEFELRSYRDQTWVDPQGESASPVPLFSRDYPALLVRRMGASSDEKPLFVFFGVHFKSKRDRPGDPQSNLLRKAQADRAVAITRAVQAEFGVETPVFIGGDFNGAANYEPEYRSFWEILGFDDAFNLKPPIPHRPDRVTHTFHPFEGVTRKSQLDAILVSPSAQPLIKQVDVYRYVNPLTGEPKAVPATRAERDENPSDHFLIFSTLDFEGLLQRP